MTNATLHKYDAIYAANRNKNELFDAWIKANYDVTIHTQAWNYGSETFICRETGERIYSEAKIMQMYVKAKLPYFRNSAHFDEWLDSDYTAQECFFAANK